MAFVCAKGLAAGVDTYLGFLEDLRARLDPPVADDYLYIAASPRFYVYEASDFRFGRPPRVELVSMNHDGEMMLIGRRCRDNFNINFWCKVLAFMRGVIHKHISKFGESPCDLLNQNRPTHLGRMVRASEAFVVYDQYHRSSQEKVPNITFQEVVYGSVMPRGKFEVLAWRSRVPPYHSHVYACELQ
ncbi:hypothetical protein BAE44_0014548 [Dichanthelium oligosanthes]|uniref:Uncharacterized protein n=1 Tax=Dichanthelium oligosanthes TaxID=888268 RepID=A0A1E5VH44_9POAL|nr:hypothetical protein BAE44_0014548 [Dichanthelium oligosanthes]